MNQLNELAKNIHQNAKDKGFWDNPRNTGEIFMLIISEASEALEAHRKGGIAQIEKFEFLVSKEITFDFSFITHIKDTVADELADVVIRILDYCFVQHIEINPENFDEIESLEISENFAEALLQITGSIYYASVSARAFEQRENDLDREILIFEIHESIWMIMKLCEREGIDLIKHIELKMKYNATRERMHGKAY